MNKRIRTSLVAAGLVGGSILGVTQVGGVANAQTDDETVTTEQTENPPVDEQTDDETEADGDAETATGRRGRHRGMGAALDAVAEVIGIEADELRTEVRDGATLGDVAEANGVDSAEVVAVIVDAKQDRIAQAVEDGRITQEQADERTAELEDRVTTRVEEGRPERADTADGADGADGEGRSGRRGPGNRGGADADSDSDSDIDTEADVDTDADG